MLKITIGEKIIKINKCIGESINDIDDRLTQLEQNGGYTVDAALDSESTNPVQNKVLTVAFNQAAEEINSAIGGIGSAVQSLSAGLDNKQDTLVSGESIKTVNGQSLLGEGNITIEGGGGSITVDDTFNPESTNPVQNKVITAAMTDAMGAMTSMQTAVTNIPKTVETYVEQYISEALGGEY